MRIVIVSIALILSAPTSFAQPDAMNMQDDVPIDTYLALLAQVAPPARDGVAALRRGDGIALAAGWYGVEAAR